MTIRVKRIRKSKIVRFKREEKRDMNTVAMNNLWTYLQGLSLTAKNKKWLSERLIEPKAVDMPVMTDEEIKEGLNLAFMHMKEVNEGKRLTRDINELLNEL